MLSNKFQQYFNCISIEIKEKCPIQWTTKHYEKIRLVTSYNDIPQLEFFSLLLTRSIFQKSEI